MVSEIEGKTFRVFKPTRSYVPEQKESEKLRFSVGQFLISTVETFKHKKSSGLKRTQGDL